jgi:hypothetical protein
MIGPKKGASHGLMQLDAVNTPATSGGDNPRVRRPRPAWTKEAAPRLSGGSAAYPSGIDDFYRKACPQLRSDVGSPSFSGPWEIDSERTMQFRTQNCIGRPNFFSTPRRWLAN